MKYAKDALRVGCTLWTFGCDRAIKLEFHGAKVSSDTGLFPYRDLEEAVQLTDSGAAELFDFRTGTNVQHRMTALLRQSVYSRLAGYEDVNDGPPSASLTSVSAVSFAANSFRRSPRWVPIACTLRGWDLCIRTSYEQTS